MNTRQLIIWPLAVTLMVWRGGVHLPFSQINLEIVILLAKPCQP